VPCLFIYFFCLTSTATPWKLRAPFLCLQAELTQPFARFLSVGLGLLYLGKQEAVEATLEVIYLLCLLQSGLRLFPDIVSIQSQRCACGGKGGGERSFDVKQIWSLPATLERVQTANRGKPKERPSPGPPAPLFTL